MAHDGIIAWGVVARAAVRAGRVFAACALLALAWLACTGTAAWAQTATVEGVSVGGSGGASCAGVCALPPTPLHARAPARPVRGSAPASGGSSCNDAVPSQAAVEGVVTDAETGAALPLANVRVEGGGPGVATDSTGAYRLAGLPPGAVTLVASYVGYTPARRTLDLAPGATARADFALDPADLTAEGVTVTGARVESGDLGVERLDPEAIRDLPTVLEPDIFRSLQLLPGVKAASDFSSGLYIRGGSPDQTLILLDRAPVYNPSHVFGFFSTFNPDAIDDVLLYKGGFPATYGGRLGSVVALGSRRGPEGGTGGLEGRASLGLLSARGYVAGPLARWPGGAARGTWSVAVRRSTLEPLLATLNGLDVDDIPEGFYFYDLNAAARYDLTRRDRVELSVYAGRDQLDFPFFGSAVFDVSYGNEAVTGSWRRLLSDRASLSVAGTFTRYVANPEAGLSGTRFVRDTDLVDTALDADLAVEVSPKHALDAGLRAGSFLSKMTNAVDNDEKFSPRTRSTYGAAYVQDTYRPSDAWQLTAGLRLNYFAEGDDWRLAPRLSAEYRATDAVRLQAGFGRYYQALSLFSSELFSAFDFWLTSDQGVPPAYGDQFVVGLKTEPGGVLGFDALTVDVEAYVRTMRDLFRLETRIADYTGIPYEETLLFGEGRAYGVEMLVRGERGRLGGFVAYTLARTTRRFAELEDGARFSPRFDRTHDLNLVSRYDLGRRWQATAVFTYATGQAFTDPNGFFRLYDARFAAATTLDGLIARFNAARLPAYHRLDVGARRTGPFFGLGQYELQLQMLNVYSRRNVWFYLYDSAMDNTISRSTVPQIPIPLPNVALTVTF